MAIDKGCDYLSDVFLIAQTYSPVCSVGRPRRAGANDDYAGETNGRGNAWTFS